MPQVLTAVIKGVCIWVSLYKYLVYILKSNPHSFHNIQKLEL